jgi:hypothetical protein
VELGRLIYYQLSKLRKNSDELREELDTFIKRTTVLRECAYQHRFIDELLFHVIRNKVRVGAVQANFAVNTGLAFITSNETGRIGKSLAKVLMTNTTSGAATDEYISKYPALEELAAEYGWFKPMLRAIAEELMSGVLYVRARSRDASELRASEANAKEGQAKRAQRRASQAFRCERSGRRRRRCCFCPFYGTGRAKRP